MEPTTAPDTLPAAPRRANPLVSILIVAFTVVIVCLVLFKTYPPAQHAAQNAVMPLVYKAETIWGLAFLPSELRNARFVTSTGTYRASYFSFVPAAVPLQAAAKTVFEAPYNAQAQKANPQVSPTKSLVVFQQLIDSQRADTASGWQVDLARPQHDEQRVLGTGVHPFFVDETHVARFTEQGLMVSDISNASSTVTVLLPQTIPDKAHTEAVSPNQSLVAYKNTEKSKIEVYNITDTNAMLVTSYTGTTTSFALSNKALYLLTVGPTRTTIQSYPFMPGAALHTVATFPTALGITSLVFPGAGQ